MRKKTQDRVLAGNQQINTRVNTLFTQFIYERGYTDLKFAKLLKLPKVNSVRQMMNDLNVLDVGDVLRFCLELSIQPKKLITYLTNNDDCVLSDIQLPEDDKAIDHGLDLGCRVEQYTTVSQDLNNLLIEVLQANKAFAKVTYVQIAEALEVDNKSFVAKALSGERAVDMAFIDAFAGVTETDTESIVMAVVNKYNQSFRALGSASQVGSGLDKG